MTKSYEDLLYNDNSKILKFSEYRKGSNEYGQIINDLMMFLRFKKEQNKNSDFIIIHKSELKNIDFNKLKDLLQDDTKRKKLGLSFDVEFLDNNKIKFHNLNNKESRPWENFISFI